MDLILFLRIWPISQQFLDFPGIHHAPTCEFIDEVVIKEVINKIIMVSKTKTSNTWNYYYYCNFTQMGL